PDGFARAAAEVYRRLAGYKDAPTPPSATEVAERLVKEPALLDVGPGARP
ncbi:MAG: hypothetical protein HYV62_17600, partial [Candidatus Rokubacteria bacterium]|nr:hypothetical protein [Candidatus Rokubacteria bacterium]